LTKQTSTPGRKGKIVSALVVLILILVLGGIGWYLITPGSANLSTTISAQSEVISTDSETSESSTSSSANLAAALLSGNPPTLGSPNASVTIVEFGDYQCPTCDGWYNTQEASVIQNLVDTGKAKLVWRDFDYFGPDSVSASEAAYAAGEQGKFWQFHDLLFQNQQAPNNGWASRQNLEKLAVQLGLNMTKFDAAFNSGNYDSLINSNHNLGVQADVTETPTFFLIGPNGKMVTIAGEQPESVFEQAVAQLTS